MATSGVFVLSLCCIYLSVEPSVGESVEGSSTPQEYRFSEAWGGLYKLHSQPGTWEWARLTCESEGAALATPYTIKASKSLVAIMNETHFSDGMFIGVLEGLTRGDFRSIEGIALCRIPHHWANGEPNSSENCFLALLPDGTLAVKPCSTMLPFVCYKKQEEIISCLDQCNPSYPEYKFYESTGSCYKFHKVARLWGKAYLTCQEEGGHLVIINSQVEEDILQAMLVQHPPSAIVAPSGCTTGIFLGSHNFIKVSGVWADPMNWRNLDGKTMNASGWQKWDVGQPNNWSKSKGGEDENCGFLWRSSGLNDYPCSSICPFVCEIEPPPIHV